MMENENSKLKKYLLNNLASHEAEKIDLQIIADAGLEENLYLAENDLMEDYLDETLSPPEIELFEKNFLVSRERETGLRQLALLRKFARRELTKKSPVKLLEDKSSAGFFESFKKFLSSNRRLAAAFALVIGCSLIGIILYNQASEETPLEKEYARINQSDLNDLGGFANITNLNLAAGTYRNSGGAIKYPGDKFSERVLARLALPPEINSTDTFKVEIIRDGKVVFTQNKIRFYNNPGGQELRLLLPSTLLIKGDYQIKAGKESAEESAHIYSFTVR